MKQRAFVSAAAAILGTFLATAPLSAQVRFKAGESTAERAEQLKAKGWAEVETGFFQKRTAGRIEHVALAPEGMPRAIAGLRGQYARLLERNKKSPSPELAKALRAMKQTLGKLTRMPAQPLAAQGWGCNLDVGSNAWAYPENNYVVGIGAGHHYSDCYTGEAYASAYVSSSSGSQFHAAFDWGQNVDVASGLTNDGPPPCHSEGYGYGYDYDLGVFVDSFASNDTCGQ